MWPSFRNLDGPVKCAILSCGGITICVEENWNNLVFSKLQQNAWKQMTSLMVQLFNDLKWVRRHMWPLWSTPRLCTYPTRIFTCGWVPGLQTLKRLQSAGSWEQELVASFRSVYCLCEWSASDLEKPLQFRQGLVSIRSAANKTAKRWKNSLPVIKVGHRWGRGRIVEKLTVVPSTRTR